MFLTFDGFFIMFKYDLKYWNKMLRQNSKTAQRINKIRWNLVVTLPVKRILDYGSGPGFFAAFAPEGYKVDTYDINNYPQTGIKHRKYDLITFWDVLEHFHDLSKAFKDMRRLKAKYIAITVPVVRPGLELKTWKHYKPGEHFHYLSKKEWDEVFKFYGFKKLRGGFYECPPREDIYSAVYEKEKTK